MMKTHTAGSAMILAAMVMLLPGGETHGQLYVWQLYDEWDFGGTNNWAEERRFGAIRGLTMDVLSSVDHSVDGEVRGNPTCVLDLPHDLPR